jgi:hypothetical protein
MDTFRAAAGFAALCLIILTVYATVLFVQHEADRNALRNTQQLFQGPCPTTGEC